MNLTVAEDRSFRFYRLFPYAYIEPLPFAIRHGNGRQIDDTDIILLRDFGVFLVKFLTCRETSIGRQHDAECLCASSEILQSTLPAFTVFIRIHIQKIGPMAPILIYIINITAFCKLR